MEQNKWIDVNVKLPEDGEKVIVVQNPNTTATRHSLFAIFENGKFRDPFFEIHGRMMAAYWVDIILWQPLPPPPTDLTDQKG